MISPKYLLKTHFVLFLLYYYLSLLSNTFFSLIESFLCQFCLFQQYSLRNILDVGTIYIFLCNSLCILLFRGIYKKNLNKKIFDREKVIINSL